jgi:hypothetical protein
MYSKEPIIEQYDGLIPHIGGLTVCRGPTKLPQTNPRPDLHHHCRKGVFSHGLRLGDWPQKQVALSGFKPDIIWVLHPTVLGFPPSGQSLGLVIFFFS